MPLKRFSFNAPPRKVVLMPDALFFTRVVPVNPAGTAAEVVSAVELALEGLSPFPLAQLYYGHFWKPGANHALVYAAYRKRFAAEQSESWADADLVFPGFAALLGATVKPSTAIVISTDEGLTAIYWSDPSDVPSQVVTRTWLPEASPLERDKVRDEVLKSFGGSQAVVSLADLPGLDREASESDFVFRAGELVSHLDREQADLLDVRDKGELAARRAARSRDVILWRSFMGCAIALIVCSAIEIALIGGHVWQKSRVATVDRQRPVVDQVQTAQTLATHIEELSTKRLRPFEMIFAVNEKRPASIQFLRTTANMPGPDQRLPFYTLEVEAQTTVPSDLLVYVNTLNQLPGTFKPVEIPNQRTRDGLMSFTLNVFFRPDAFNAATQP
jgi:hypothetical protein